MDTKTEPPEIPDLVISGYALGELLGISNKRIIDLVRVGIIPQATRGRYRIRTAVRAYCTNLREVASRSGPGGGIMDALRGNLTDSEDEEGLHPVAPNLTAEKARLAKAQADGVEMKNAVARRELLVREEVDQAVIGVLSVVKTRLLGIPSTAAPLVAAATSIPEVQQTLYDFIEEALRELSSFAERAISGDFSEVVEGAEPSPKADDR